MGYPDNTGWTPRASIHLSLPEPSFNVGLTPATMSVRPNHALECVEVTLSTEDAEYQLALSIHSAINAMLKLVSAVDSLTRPEREP